MGDPSVGKSCFLRRFVTNKFTEHHISTVGVDWQNKDIDVNGESVELQIWDTAGQDRIQTVTKQYFNNCQGIVVIYDCSNPATF